MKQCIMISVLLVMSWLFVQLHSPSIVLAEQFTSFYQKDSVVVNDVMSSDTSPLNKAKSWLMYGCAVFLLVYEWFARNIPTVSTYSILTWLNKLATLLVPDNILSRSKYAPDRSKGNQIQNIDLKTFKQRWRTFMSGKI